MKKILSIALVMTLLISSAAFAAKSATGNVGKIGYGMLGTTPTLRFNINDGLSGQVGLNYVTCSTAGAAGQLTILGEMAWDVMTIGQNTATSGVLLNYVSNAGNASNVNSTTVSWALGVETNLNPNLTVGLLVFPISYTSVSAGATTTWMSFLNTATLTGHIYL